jgi:DNA-binding transcriptional LysR family regulator
VELRRLSYFARVAEDGSLTRSAALLRIAQPALSRQMRLLEEELGVQLFVRTARGMRLTEAGEQLRASVAGPLRQVELGLANLRPTHHRSLGNLAIGLTPGMGEILGEPLGIRLVRDFEDAAIRIVEGPTGALADWLARGVVDLAILEEASRDNRIDDRPIAEDELWFVGPAPPGAEGDEAIAFEHLYGLPLILQSHHLGVRTAIDAAATRAGRMLDVRAYADAPRLARQLVAAGFGHSILPSAYCRPAIARGEVTGRPLSAPALRIGFHLSARRNAQLSSKLLADVARTVTEEARAKLYSDDVGKLRPSGVPASS